MNKSLISIVFTFVMLLCFSSKAQNIYKISKNNSSENGKVFSKVLALNNSTDVTFVNPNGLINYGSEICNIIQLSIADSFSLNNFNTSLKNNIDIAIIKVPSDFNSTIDLNNLNQFSALNFIYLIVEKNLTDNELISMINSSNTNWTIAYQFSLPD